MRRVTLVIILVFGITAAYAQTEKRTDCKLQDLAVAAALGDPEAQFFLGTEFYSGGDLPQDYAKAATMWRLSAKAGIVGSYNNLGYLTYYGLGVKQDFAEGLRLWRIAAEQGFAESQFHIGYAYIDGKYLKKNYVEGFAWLLSARHFAKEAQESDILKMVEDEIAEIRDLLSPNQLTIAKSRSNLYIAKYRPK